MVPMQASNSFPAPGAGAKIAFLHNIGASAGAKRAVLHNDDDAGIGAARGFPAQ